jgi:rhodanese-related sulfurtransferase
MTARHILAGTAALLALLAAAVGTRANEDGGARSNEEGGWRSEEGSRVSSLLPPRSSFLAPPSSLLAASLAHDIETEADHVTAMELAGWIRHRKPGLRVLDVRSGSEFTAYHIPSAERVPITELTKLAPRDGETLVLYSEGGAHAAQGWVLLRALGHEHVYFLRGGLLDWMDDVMSPVIPNASSATRDSLAALSRYFGGVPRVGAVDAASRVALPASAPTASAAVEKLRRRGC